MGGKIVIAKVLGDGRAYISKKKVRELGYKPGDELVVSIIGRLGEITILTSNCRDNCWHEYQACSGPDCTRRLANCLSACDQA